MTTATKRLHREAVERQISEMWDALGGAPRDDTYAHAEQEARRIEADLRAGLAAQDRLDQVAPKLLAAARDVIDRLGSKSTNLDGLRAAIAEAVEQPA